MPAGCQLVLEGEWSVEHAADLLSFLGKRLAGYLQAEPRPERVEIDFSGMVEVDACGCQLLAVFLENLRRHGLAPCPCNISVEVENKISLLGFAQLIAVGEQVSEVAA